MRNNKICESVTRVTKMLYFYIYQQHINAKSHSKIERHRSWKRTLVMSSFSVEEVLRDRVLESKFDQKVVNAEPEFLRPHEPFHHPDDGRAFAVGYCVEHGVDLIGGVDSDDDRVRAEGCVL